MKMKTSELTKHALNWAVAKCEGRDDPIYRFGDKPEDFYISGPQKQGPYNPTTNWSQGGPIIEREKIAVRYDDVWAYDPADPEDNGERWYAAKPSNPYNDYGMYGPTPLIAAMRYYVASKWGAEVEIPDELKS